MPDTPPAFQLIRFVRSFGPFRAVSGRFGHRSYFASGGRFGEFSFSHHICFASGGHLRNLVAVTASVSPRTAIFTNLVAVTRSISRVLAVLTNLAAVTSSISPAFLRYPTRSEKQNRASLLTERDTVWRFQHDAVSERRGYRLKLRTTAYPHWDRNSERQGYRLKLRTTAYPHWGRNSERRGYRLKLRTAAYPHWGRNSERRGYRFKAFVRTLDRVHQLNVSTQPNSSAAHTHSA